MRIIALFKLLIRLTLLVSFVNIASHLSAAENAPRFTLFNEKDNLVKLSTLLEKSNIIVAFWASYCVPCKREIPQLAEIEKKYGKPKNLKLVLINIDKEGKVKGLPFLKDINISNECLFDIYQITIKKYVPDMKIPATFIISKKGDIVFRIIGESEENIRKLKTAIKEMN